MICRLSILSLLVLPGAAFAVGEPPISLSTARATAKTAMAQVAKKTPGATTSGVSRCAHPKGGGSSLADCKGWVKITSKPICRLTVRIHESSEGPVWTFRGASTCSKRSGSSLPSGGAGGLY